MSQVSASSSSNGGMTASSLYLSRQERLATLLADEGLAALALNPGPSLSYLTGLSFHLMERPVVAIFFPHNPPVVVLPELEAGKVERLPYPVKSFKYGEDPTTWVSVFRKAARAADLNGRKIGVEPTRLRVLELRLLESAAPAADFVPAANSLSQLRIRKDDAEVAAMRRAVEIAQRALQATLPAVKAGVSEREIASELTLQLLRSGSDSEFPFTPIVAGGPNSANPHAIPTQRMLKPGDLLVIDWGAADSGYISDLTRTFAIGEVDAEQQKIARMVLEANQAGREAARPGAAAGEVDRAARAVIDAAGYAEYFTHRTGHGIGMEGHEEPYMRAGNPLILEPGMAFTVEPGIYLPGKGGVRIEDNVVITHSGAETLSDLARELVTLE